MQASCWVFSFSYFNAGTQENSSVQVKIAKVKDKQLQKIGKLADKHALATWDEKVLDKAFSFIKESGQEQFKNN